MDAEVEGENTAYLWCALFRRDGDGTIVAVDVRLLEVSEEALVALEEEMEDHWEVEEREDKVGLAAEERCLILSSEGAVTIVSGNMGREFDEEEEGVEDVVAPVVLVDAEAIIGTNRMDQSTNQSIRGTSDRQLESE